MKYIFILVGLLSLIIISMFLFTYFISKSSNNEKSKKIIYDRQSIDTDISLSDMVNFHRNNGVIHYEI